PNHQLVVLRQDLLQALIEVGLQILVILHAVRVDERLDPQIGVPVLSIDLIPANVKVGVGEKLGHLVDELLEEFISPFLGGISNGIRSLRIDLVRTGVAGQFWISDKPRPTVAGRIELREDADAAIVRVGHKVAELALRIIHAIGSHLVQLRKALALDAKALVIGEVQVQNVQLYRRHPIHITFEHIERNEVAADVDEQDRKSTRLNSSHVKISYAVFCLKKKNKTARPSDLTKTSP